jgi:glycosyltransferase involved in cell wall biosynthesis
MRILMVSDDYLPNPGGIAAHVHELSCALAELGHEVDLIAGHDLKHQGTLPELPPGLRILSHRGFRWSAPGYASMAAVTARMIWRARRLRRYDVCHWHSLIWETWGVALGAARLPRVFTNHSSGYLRRARSRLRRSTQLRAILGRADRVIAPSPELLERSVDAGYPRERLRYIPNGVDVRTFAPGERDPELMQRYGLSDSDKVIAVPRRLDPKNGVDVLIRALPSVASAIPNVKVLLIGDGVQRAELEALVAELGLTRLVVFCGTQPRAEMVRHLRLGHVATLPSRAEAVSLAGLEAMAVGLPVVGSRVGGIPEFVTDGENGALVPVDDPLALSRALAALLADAQLRKNLGRRARAGVQDRFSWRGTALQTLDVYAAALGAGPR